MKVASILPLFVGLFFMQVLAIACNVFLDIRYGGFGTEMMIWSSLFAYSLSVGYRGHGNENVRGQKRQRFFLGLTFVAFFLLFNKIWEMPRSAIYALAMIQVAYNCVSVSRRQWLFSMLITLSMVIFACSHDRANWAMLFYALPYFIVLIFLLVAVQQVRNHGQHTVPETEALTKDPLSPLSLALKPGYWLATCTATLSILLTALLLYAITPQIQAPMLFSSWGSPTPVAQENGPTTGDGGSAANGNSTSAGSGETPSLWSQTGLAKLWNDWPDSHAMQQMAAQPGMPGWQHDSLQGMAQMMELVESQAGHYRAVKQWLDEKFQAMSDWLSLHLQSVVLAMLLILLYALYLLLREARIGLWCHSRLDYVQLKYLPHRVCHPQFCYAAMLRLYTLREAMREPHENTTQYAFRMQLLYRDVWRECGLITRAYEDMRFGQQQTILAEQLPAAYLRIYQLFQTL